MRKYKSVWETTSSKPLEKTRLLLGLQSESEVVGNTASMALSSSMYIKNPGSFVGEGTEEEVDQWKTEEGAVGGRKVISAGDVFRTDLVVKHL